MRAAALSLFLLGACATAPAPVPPPAPVSAHDLAGTSWTRIDDERAPTAPTIAFTARGASGFAGCNRWFGAARRDGETLTFGNTPTRRSETCADAADAAEGRFIAALRATRSARRDSDTLTFFDANGAAVAHFRAGVATGEQQ